MAELRLTDSFGGDLPSKLKSARQAAGLSTREVAERLADRVSVSHATIANYEKGRTQPPLDVLAELARVYRRDPQWFLERTSPLTGVRYRHYKSKVTAAEKQQYEASGLRWLEAYF